MPLSSREPLYSRLPPRRELDGYILGSGVVDYNQFSPEELAARSPKINAMFYRGDVAPVRQSPSSSGGGQFWPGQGDDKWSTPELLGLGAAGLLGTYATGAYKAPRLAYQAGKRIMGFGTKIPTELPMELPKPQNVPKQVLDTLDIPKKLPEIRPPSSATQPSRRSWNEYLFPSKSESRLKQLTTPETPAKILERRIDRVLTPTDVDPNLRIDRVLNPTLPPVDQEMRLAKQLINGQLGSPPGTTLLPPPGTTYYPRPDSLSEAEIAKLKWNKKKSGLLTKLGKLGLKAITGNSKAGGLVQKSLHDLPPTFFD